MADATKAENPRPRKPLAHERLKAVLVYDPKTGKFFWTARTAHRIHIGDEAGGVNTSDGYRYIRIDGQLYAAHRLAIFYETGSWPLFETDHKNTSRDNNEFVNLREATRSQNAANTKRPITNTSGVKGVHWARNERKWVAAIKVNGRTKTLGYFIDIDKARLAYQRAAHVHFGEFARTE